MIEEVREFLSLFEGKPQEAPQRLYALAKALDKLACAYHAIGPATDFDHYSVDENSDYKSACALIRKHFPDFGYYSEIAPISKTSSPPMVADAIDDLVDIRSEMLEAHRLWEDGRTSEAEQHFRAGYELHWGRFHLHSLRDYVNELIFSQ